MAAAPRTPAIVAIERLAKLAMAGTPVPRMILTVEGIVAAWRSEAIGPRDVQERLDALRDDVEAGIVAAESYVADAETEAERKAATTQLDGLRASHAVLLREMDLCGAA